MNAKEYLKKILSANIHVEDKKLEESLNELGTPITDKPHQQLVTGADGKAKWADSGYIKSRIAIQYIPGDNKVGNPGASSVKLVNNVSCLIKVSDYVPTMEELFAPDTTLVLADTGESLGKDDTTYVYDGAYGRWRFDLNPYNSDLPGVLVVPKSFIVAGIYDCYEPGIYMWAGSLGRAWSGSKLNPKQLELELTCSVPMSDVAIPHVQSASVGQTVVVKAVDENGKPTEWEAVDMATYDPNTMYLPITQRYTGGSEYVCEASFEDTLAAIKAGYCHGAIDHNNWIYNVVNRTSDFIVFARMEVSPTSDVITVRRLDWTRGTTSMNMDSVYINQSEANPS